MTTHSKSLLARLGLLVTDLVLASVAVATAYFSGTNQWRWFWLVSTAAMVLYALTRVAEAWPRILELRAFEDVAARVARSALAYGVDRFYNMQSPEDQHSRNADTVAEIRAATAMWLCANSGASYLDPGVYRHWATVEARLRDGVPFKVVLLDPFSAEKRFRDRLNVGEDAPDSKINIANLVRLYNEYPSLEIRCARLGMHVTVFATPTCMFVDPYHSAVVGQRIENRSFCLRIRRATPSEALGYYDLFKEHVSSLWRTSTDFEDWLEENAALLPKSVGTIVRRHRRADAG